MNLRVTLEMAVVGCFFFFLMGTGDVFGQLGIGYGKNTTYSFTAEHGFYTFCICPSPGETLMISGLHLLWNRTNSA